jgi:hypothetical protein
LVDGYWANVVTGAHGNDPQQDLVFSSWDTLSQCFVDSVNAVAADDHSATNSYANQHIVTTTDTR